jgi:hypothetical protein
MEVLVLARKLVSIVLGLGLWFGAARSARAEDVRFSADLDLVPWASKGHSFWLGAAPAEHWKVMLGSVSGDLPDFTQPTGWHQRSISGTAMMAQYAFAADGSGPYVGAVAVWMQWGYARTDMPDVEVERDQLILAAVAGYTWFPAHNGFYLAGLLGIGKGVFDHGKVALAGETYADKLPFAVLPGVFTGYQWGRR